MRSKFTKPTEVPTLLPTRGYQQEMLEESLQSNIVIALDTGSGKTHIAVLRMKHECERQQDKVCMPPLSSQMSYLNSRGVSYRGSSHQRSRCVDSNVL